MKRFTSSLLTSPRLRPEQHLRDLRQWRGQGTNGAGAGNPQPTWAGQLSVAEKIGGELPEHAEERGREGGRGG